MINTIVELFKQWKKERDKILAEEQFDGNYKINATGGFRGEHYLEEYNVYVSTSYGIDAIVRFIDRLLKYANVSDNEVLVSFKE